MYNCTSACKCMHEKLKSVSTLFSCFQSRVLSIAGENFLNRHMTDEWISGLLSNHELIKTRENCLSDWLKRNNIWIHAIGMKIQAICVLVPRFPRYHQQSTGITRTFFLLSLYNLPNCYEKICQRTNLRKLFCIKQCYRVIKWNKEVSKLVVISKGPNTHFSTTLNTEQAILFFTNFNIINMGVFAKQCTVLDIVSACFSLADWIK